MSKRKTTTFDGSVLKKRNKETGIVAVATATKYILYLPGKTIKYINAELEKYFVNNFFSINLEIFDNKSTIRDVNKKKCLFNPSPIDTTRNDIDQYIVYTHMNVFIFKAIKENGYNFLNIDLLSSANAADNTTPDVLPLFDYIVSGNLCTTYGYFESTTFDNNLLIWIPIGDIFAEGCYFQNILDKFHSNNNTTSEIETCIFFSPIDKLNQLYSNIICSNDLAKNLSNSSTKCLMNTETTCILEMYNYYANQRQYRKSTLLHRKYENIVDDIP